MSEKKYRDLQDGEIASPEHKDEMKLRIGGNWTPVLIPVLISDDSFKDFRRPISSEPEANHSPLPNMPDAVSWREVNEGECGYWYPSTEMNDYVDSLKSRHASLVELNRELVKQIQLLILRMQSEMPRFSKKDKAMRESFIKSANEIVCKSTTTK